jgi:hypothetical protein
MGQESIIKSSTIAKLKAHGSTQDSPFFILCIRLCLNLMNQRKGCLVLLLLHYLMLHILVNQPRVLVNLNIRGHFAIILINVAGLSLIINPNWSLRHIKPIGPIQEGLALYFLLRGCHTVILINMTCLFLGSNPSWSLRCLKPIGPIQEELAVFFSLLHTHQFGLYFPDR